MAENPNPVAPLAPAPAAGAPALNVQELKSRLNLPETASDLDLITALIAVIGELQQKYDALLSDAVALEGKVANRDLEEFAILITNDTREFWKEQLIVNREAALKTLEGLRTLVKQPAPPATPPAAPPPAVPLKNRLQNTVRSIADLAGTTPPASVAAAVKLRNRATEIARVERIPFSAAFRRAEQEAAPSAV